MPPEVQWRFEIDAGGRLRSCDDAIPVKTVEPGEYLITLPLPIARHLGIAAHVQGDAFLSAAPGDDVGNKPNTVRVLAMSPQPFIVILSTK